MMNENKVMSNPPGNRQLEDYMEMYPGNPRLRKGSTFPVTFSRGGVQTHNSKTVYDVILLWFGHVLHTQHHNCNNLL